MEAIYSVGTTYFWVGIAAVFIVLEIFTPLFGFVLVGGAALFAAGAAALGLNLSVQLGVFAVVLILSFWLLRPRLISKLHSSSHVPSRTEAVVNKIGKITEDIDPVTGTGRVVVDGEDWAAMSEVPLRAGANVKIVGADGIRLKVIQS
jgi:membrane protein implicated in regulation of membrane protease activity